MMLDFHLLFGGMTNGITAVELAAAYETIENGGVYREPLFYTKVEKANGEIYIQKEQKTERVFSEQNAWLLTELLKHPIYGGAGTGPTGTTGAISGQEVRGKTGTTNGNSAAWFCRIY